MNKRVLTFVLPVTLLVALVVLGKVGYGFSRYTLPSRSFFLHEIRSIDLESLRKQEGIISHLVEDFSTYDEYSESLDPFEDTRELLSNGSIEGTSTDNYGGERSVRIAATRKETTVSRVIHKDLSRWQDQGVLSMWLNLCDETAIDRIDLRLIDADGKDITLGGIQLVHLPRERNALQSDDDFPDYFFRGRQPLLKWEDYLLIPGWNYVFWEYAKRLPIDMGRVKAYEVRVIGNKEQSQTMLFDNLRIQDGLLKDRNPLNGHWYSPNGAPMYGVFDYEGKGRVRLLNVEWDQYPSNGDHVRILSREATPESFLMRVRFKVVKLAPKNMAAYHQRWLRSWLPAKGENSRSNTYFRLVWDFDNEYDPGHDWFGIYNSLENEYLGYYRVYPIERYFVQGAETGQGSRKSMASFGLKNNQEYEFNVKVEGQRATTVVYEVYPRFLKEVTRISYTFRMKRPAKRYPIAIETTGNIQIELHAIEVVSLR